MDVYYDWPGIHDADTTEGTEEEDTLVGITVPAEGSARCAEPEDLEAWKTVIG